MPYSWSASGKNMHKVYKQHLGNDEMHLYQLWVMF